MFGLPDRQLIEMVSLVLLGGWHGVRLRTRDKQDMRDCALAVAAMVQAARYARRGRVNERMRHRLVAGILRLNAGSVEYALGGRVALSPGLREFLSLAALDVADHAQTSVLDAVHRYVRTARRLRRRRQTRRLMFEALYRIRGAAVTEPARREALIMLARRLQPGRGSLEGDMALVWLYGLRAAWLWCDAGGGPSPFGFVPRALTAAARELLEAGY
ncbi:hypothetical protein BJI67_12730 [Acidihalobacter aeolianus]|uniref:Uncharacterized protein n=1 Tax=Acidihalobacter aeolianus TaxID=2792603 RepID=A0A1D8K9Z6_9GAMM|nr:hypothetical protein [Acidihalobacter aeolianus]AOV17798.1 hypothetical protein BJI67_12730 [Acidihalobacter aeolianus]